MSSLVLLCPDPVGERMRGLGIRYAELARTLGGAGVAVTLAAPEVPASLGDGVRLLALARDDVRSLRGALAGAATVLSPPDAPHVLRELRRSRARIAIDLYDPAPLEALERHARDGAVARAVHATTALDRLIDALASGHHFICASERQRDLWIGGLLACGRVTPAAYASDPTLRSLVDIVAFGVPVVGPAPVTHDPIRACFPDIGADDRVLLWNGGLWAWLDAPTAIAAVARVRARGIAARLVVMGASDAGGGADALAEARAAARRHGISDAVHINRGWVPYAERGAWLQCADAVVSAHREHLETRYAFRTRLLDCLWARVPAVVTGGDELAARIAADDLGAVSAPGDVAALANGIEQVLTRNRDSYAPRLAAAAAELAWPRVAAPLVAFADPSSVETPRHRQLPFTGARSRPLRRAGMRLTRVTRLTARRAGRAARVGRPD